jgi:hypothetical protein
VAGLVAIFKDFAPITDYIGDKIAYLSGAFRGLQSAMFSFASGTGFTTEAIGEQAEAMERASQMQRTYEDNIDALNLKQTDYEVQIDKLLKQAKNKSISDKEANDLIKEATRLQGLQIEQLKQISKFETSMLVEKAKGYGATYKQILAIQNGASIESLGNLSNELDGALSKLQQNYEKRKGEEGALDERKIKIENAQAAREEKIKAEEEKRAAERLKIKEDEKKREEAESKDRADRAKEYDDQQAKQLENDRARQASINESDREQYAAHIADLRSIAADETLSEEERVAALIELNKKKQLSDEETAAASVAIAQKEKDAKVALLDAYSSILGSAAEIAGKDTAAGKALAVASATIATYTAIAKTLAANAANTPLAIASSIAIGLQGFAAVRNILAVKVPNSGGAGGGGGGSMPSMNLPTTRPSSGFTMLGNEDPLRTTNEGGMVRVFVTESDITTSQNRVSSIQAKATIG